VQLRANAFHQINATAPLTVSGSNNLTIDTLWKPSTVSVGAGLSALASDANGTLQLALTGTDSRAQLSLIDSQGTVRNLVPSITGALTYNGSTLVDLTYHTNALAQKQDVLSSYSESGTNTYYIHTNETSAPIAIFLAWDVGSYTNQTGYQQVSVGGGCYEVLSSLPTSGTAYLSVELQSGAANEVILSVNDTTTWTGHQATKITGLTTAWQTFTWSFQLYSGTLLAFHLGNVPSGSGLTQQNGDVKLRYLKIWAAVPSSVISRNLTVQGDVTCTGSITCVSVTQTSDESIKQNVAPASLLEIMKVFDAIDVKTYQRTDMPGNRIGFIAQDFVESLPEAFDNIVAKTYDGGVPLWSLDYARLATILWGVCKQQEIDIAVLANRISALEGGKRKK